MRFNRLDLNLLVALDALITECNVSRAAEKVHLSQSSMSHALARLREHFDDELLMQIGRKMELTPRAESLRDPIRDILVRIGATVENRPDFDPSTSDREFILHVSDYSMEVLFPHVLAIAESQSSTVRFRLLPQVGTPFGALKRGEVDILLIPEVYHSPDHPHEHVFVEEFVCLMWAGSKIAKSELTPDAYATARHVVMEPPGTGQPGFATWFAQRFKVARDIGVITYSFTTIPSMLVGTEMIATVHARVARHAVQWLPLVVKPLPLEMPELRQVMQWHQHRTRDPGLIWLRGLLKEAAARMDAAGGPMR